MADLIAERPMVVSILLFAITTSLIYGWLQTGKRQAAWAALVPLVLVPVAHWVAAEWETDREKIQTLLYELADAVEGNEIERAVRAIGDPDMQARARSELQRYRFQMASINKIRNIHFIEGSYPPEADVELSVKVDVSDNGGRFQNVRVLRLLVLRMVFKNERWSIIDYRHFPITGQPDAASQFSNQLSR